MVCPLNSSLNHWVLLLVMIYQRPNSLALLLSDWLYDISFLIPLFSIKSIFYCFSHRISWALISQKELNFLWIRSSIHHFYCITLKSLLFIKLWVIKVHYLIKSLRIVHFMCSNLHSMTSLIEFLCWNLVINCNQRNLKSFFAIPNDDSISCHISYPVDLISSSNRVIL